MYMLARDRRIEHSGSTAVHRGGVDSASAAGLRAAVNELSDESRALLERHAIAVRADILYDLAMAATAVEVNYDPARWDVRAAARELPDLKRRLRAVLCGLGLPLE